MKARLHRHEEAQSSGQGNGSSNSAPRRASREAVSPIASRQRERLSRPPYRLGVEVGDSVWDAGGSIWGLYKTTIRQLEEEPKAGKGRNLGGLWRNGNGKIER